MVELSGGENPRQVIGSWKFSREFLGLNLAILVAILNMQMSQILIIWDSNKHWELLKKAKNKLPKQVLKMPTNQCKNYPVVQMPGRMNLGC